VSVSESRDLAGGAVPRARLAELLASELADFARRNPRSREMAHRARASLFGGVPMPWMMLWAGGFPLFVEEASGSRIVDVDGHAYVDLCLGDTGAMTGHGPAVVREAVAKQAARGITTMLPTEDAAWVGEELSRRFGLDRWTFTLTATDANRTALRIARDATGRPKVLVFSYCYHGSVDEAFAVAASGGGTRSRDGNVGPAVDPAETTRAVEFNDVAGLEAALADSEVACVLAEPAMTNMGIVLPEPGYHEALRRLTRESETLLVIDETHTFSAGPGGCTAAWGLEPDMLTIGKAIGSGVPAGALGLSGALAAVALDRHDADYEDTGGVGGTLAGNPLSLAAMRATLEHVLGDEAFAHTIPLATRFREGLEAIFKRRSLPWNVTQLGCRAEYRFQPHPARNGSEAEAASEPELERYLHLHALNRGVMLTPFHNMALMSPETTEADVDMHTELFDAAVAELTGAEGHANATMAS
jgi:glutamate-1-semialdehyde 2,1-aminomutase